MLLSVLSPPWKKPMADFLVTAFERQTDHKGRQSPGRALFTNIHNDTDRLTLLHYLLERDAHVVMILELTPREATSLMNKANQIGGWA